jgi:hypothetical protein
MKTHARDAVKPLSSMILSYPWVHRTFTIASGRKMIVLCPIIAAEQKEQKREERIDVPWEPGKLVYGMESIHHGVRVPLYDIPGLLQSPGIISLRLFI